VKIISPLVRNKNDRVESFVYERRKRESKEAPHDVSDIFKKFSVEFTGELESAK